MPELADVPTQVELQRVIKHISSCTAPGRDSIPAEFFNGGGEQLLIECSSSTAVQVLEEGAAPQGMRDSILTTLYKNKINHTAAAATTTAVFLSFSSQESLLPSLHSVVHSILQKEYTLNRSVYMLVHTSDANASISKHWSLQPQYKGKRKHNRRRKKWEIFHFLVLACISNVWNGTTQTQGNAMCKNVPWLKLKPRWRNCMRKCCYIYLLTRILSVAKLQFFYQIMTISFKFPLSKDLSDLSTFLFLVSLCFRLLSQKLWMMSENATRSSTLSAMLGCSNAREYLTVLVFPFDVWTSPAFALAFASHVWISLWHSDLQIKRRVQPLKWGWYHCSQ